MLLLICIVFAFFNNFFRISGGDASIDIVSPGGDATARCSFNS
jgi:hypothetical protein